MNDQVRPMKAHAKRSILQPRQCLRIALNPEIEKLVTGPEGQNYTSKTENKFCGARGIKPRNRKLKQFFGRIVRAILGQFLACCKTTTLGGAGQQNNRRPNNQLILSFFQDAGNDSILTINVGAG